MDKDREDMKRTLELLAQKMQKAFGILPIDLIDTLVQIKKFIDTTEEKKDG